MMKDEAMNEEMKMSKPMSKRSQMIGIMKANISLPYLQVADIIAAEVKVSITEARGAYRYFVRQGMAPGVVDAADKVSAKKPTKKAAVEKTINAALDAKLVKATNLARMKEVAGRKNYGNRVSQAVEVEDPDFDADAARDEVERMLEERDDIKDIVPRFLHKELGLI